MIRYKGASYSPGDLAPGKNALKCHVVLLDGKRETVEINKKAPASALFDHICRRLDILEREYFGIEYEDDKKMMRWLDQSKPLKKQLKRKDSRLYFKVKFYAIDPSVLQDNTRYQFFLQLKNDIAEGRLTCLPNITASVLAYVIQAEVGDYDGAVHRAGYLTEFKLLPQLPKMLEVDITTAHVALVGTPPEDAEIQFLQKVKWLDRYGIQLFEVHGEEKVKYYLGMGPPGLSVFRDSTRVSYYVWSKIVKVSYRRKRFIVFVRGGSRELSDSQVASFAFEVGSSKAAKYIWKCCVDNIAFYTADMKVDHSLPKSRSARFVRTSSGRYIKKNSKDFIGMAGPNSGRPVTGNSNSNPQIPPADVVLRQQNPPLPPRPNLSKRKKGSKGNDGDDFDEEPLFPKYENIFKFTTKDKKSSPPITDKAPEEKPNQSSGVVANSNTHNDSHMSVEDLTNHRLSSVVELTEDDENEHYYGDKSMDGHKHDYDTDDELSQSSSDSDNHSDIDDIAGSNPHLLQDNQPRPLSYPQPQQQQQRDSSHMIYSDEDIDDTLNLIEDEQNTRPSDMAWNSSLLYDRLEPLATDKAVNEQNAMPQNTSSGILSRIRSRSTSAEPKATPESSKLPLLQEGLSPPPPPPPKIPTGQFVAPPHPPHLAANQTRRHTDGDQQQLALATNEMNERPIDCGKDQVVRRMHSKESPKPLATHTALMAWMLRDTKTRSDSAPDFPKGAAPLAPHGVHPPVPQNKPPSAAIKPPHFSAPPESKPPPLPTVSLKIPPPRAPKPPSGRPLSGTQSSPSVHHPDVAEKPPVVAAKVDITNELDYTDSSSSLETSISQALRGKSRLPPGLDIAVLTRINPELDYSAQDFAHKDSLDRRKKDNQKEVSSTTAVFSPEGSDSPREFLPPGSSHIDLVQQSSMEEEKDKILAYIKNRKVENKMSNENADSFVQPVPAEVEIKHQKKHQEKQLRKSLRNKLKRVMPNGREKKEKESESHQTGWQWNRDLAPPTSAAEVNIMPVSSTSGGERTDVSLNSNAISVPSPLLSRGNQTTAISSTGVETRGSGVGMEVEQFGIPPPQKQKQNGSDPPTTASTGQQQVVTQQQQRGWPSPSNRTAPPPTAPKPSTLPKPSASVLKPHQAAVKKPSPPIAPKPLNFRKSQENVPGLAAANQIENQKPSEPIQPAVPLQLLTLASRDSTISSSGSSQPPFSPPPPSETYAPPPYTSPSGAPDRLTSPDNAINSLLDENLPSELKSAEHRRKSVPFPCGNSGATRSNSKLPRYSEIEVLSPSPVEDKENPPAYPGNSEEFVQSPTHNSALQTILAGLPPPPPHLAALTGAGKDNADGKEPSQSPPQPPPLQQERENIQLSAMDIQQDLHSRTGSDLSDLPPAIASFMNRVRQSSAGSAQEMRASDQQLPKQPQFSPPPLAHVSHQQFQPWQDQHQQRPRISLPNEPSHSLEAQSSQLRNMPPDGSSTRSSLQENIPPTVSDKKMLFPNSSDHSSSSNEDDGEISSMSYSSSLPRPVRHHHPGSLVQMSNPRGYMQQSHFNPYPHSLPSSVSSYGGRMTDNAHSSYTHASHHNPGSVISSTSGSYQQQPLNHSANMYNHLADRPHVDRQLLERQQMDRLHAMERQKQMERQMMPPMSRPSPMEFGRQFQYPSSQPPPPVPPGTQRPQPLHLRGSQDWSSNFNPTNRQRNFSWQQEDDGLKERQVEAQRRLMLQENSRRAHWMPQHLQRDGVYHAESLQHLHNPNSTEGSWGQHQPPHSYHPMEPNLNSYQPMAQHHEQLTEHVSPYLHHSGGRHSFAAVPSGREILSPPSSTVQHQGSLQRPHQRAHHFSYAGGHQPPPPLPPGHEQSDKKNFSVIQV